MEEKKFFITRNKDEEKDVRIIKRRRNVNDVPNDKKKRKTPTPNLPSQPKAKIQACPKEKKKKER
jgi:hypothetical protein